MNALAEKTSSRIALLGAISSIKNKKGGISDDDIKAVCANAETKEDAVAGILKEMSADAAREMILYNGIIKDIDKHEPTIRLFKNDTAIERYIELVDAASDAGTVENLLTLDRKRLACAINSAFDISWPDAAIMLAYLTEDEFLASLLDENWVSLYHNSVPRGILRRERSLDEQDSDKKDEGTLLKELASKDFYGHKCVRSIASKGVERTVEILEMTRDDPAVMDFLDDTYAAGSDFFNERFAPRVDACHPFPSHPGKMHWMLAESGIDMATPNDELKKVLAYLWDEIPYADEHVLYRVGLVLKDENRRKEFLSLSYPMMTAYAYNRKDILSWRDADWWKEYEPESGAWDNISYAVINKKNGYLAMTGKGNMTDVLEKERRFFLPVSEKWFNLNMFSKKELEALLDERFTFEDVFPLARELGKANLTFGEIETLMYFEEEDKKEAKSLTAIFKELLSLTRNETACVRMKQYASAIKGHGVPGGETSAKNTAEALSKMDIPALASRLYEDFTASASLTAATLPFAKEGVLSDVPDEASAWFAIKNTDAFRKEREEGKDAEEALFTILDTDKDVAWLKEEMALDDKFYKEYEKETRAFFVEGDASVARRYMRDLDKRQTENFRLIVKAAMCGKLKKLRFQENDIEMECGTAMDKRVKDAWINDDVLSNEKYACGEDSSFRGIMEMGRRPVKTCMSYESGMYNQCLMAYFDANKKVVYVKDKSGEPVARAVMRLTKISPNGKGKNRVTFKDVEDDAVSSDEMPAVFLEKMYSGYQGSERKRLAGMLVSFAGMKAKKAGVPLVIANDYDTPSGAREEKTDVYITKSKAGEQYLDSFGGLAGPDTYNHDDMYRSGKFAVIRN